MDELRVAVPARYPREARFRALCEASMEGIAISRNGEILDANPAFARMFGYELAEVIGRHVLAFIAPEPHGGVSHDRPSAAVGLRKDGSRFRVEVCGKTIQHGDREATVTAVRELPLRNPGGGGNGATSAPNQRAQRPGSLSPREQEVLGLLARGLTNCQIAEALTLSKRTVDHHVSHLLSKLDVKNRTQAAMVAARAAEAGGMPGEWR